jgi:hypothetical protein
MFNRFSKEDDDSDEEDYRKANRRVNKKKESK